MNNSSSFVIETSLASSVHVVVGVMWTRWTCEKLDLILNQEERRKKDKRRKREEGRGKGRDERRGDRMAKKRMKYC
jgi:hypothetical protein